MQIWTNIIKDIEKNEQKNVKTAIIAANNHYAGFGPMTAKLFAEMMQLKNHLRPFPIRDYKIHLLMNARKLNKIIINKIIEFINNYPQRQDRPIFLNIFNKYFNYHYIFKENLLC